MVKKIILILLVGLLVLAFGTVASAASDINAAEQSILDRLEKGVEVNGKIVTLAQAETNVAKNFFMRDEVNFSSADAAVVIAGIDKIANVIKGENVTKITDLSLAAKQQILNFAQEAAAGVTSMAITFSYDYAKKEASVIGTDSGTVFAVANVTSESTVIKQTGFSLQTTVLVVFLLSALAVTAVLLASKKGLFTRKVALAR